MTLDLAKVEATLLAAADAAATRTLPLFRTTLAIDNKYTVGFDPVTEADRGAETAIRAVIAEAFPDHAIIGEEWGSYRRQPLYLDHRPGRRHPRLHLRRPRLGHADRLCP